MLLAAPHRLGFALAMGVLALGSLWWLAELLNRHTGALGLPAPAVPPMLVHAALMVMGFMPLFFAGFLFTAGPKWLHVPPYTARQVLPALLCQAAGWVLWLAGAYLHVAVAAGALALVTAGLGWMYALFARLVAASGVADRVHAKVVLAAGVLSTLCLGAAALALLASRLDVALALLRTALWGGMAVTYVAVAHRMIPFFTSNALPLVQAWRPWWVLWFMLAALIWQVLAVWVPEDWASGAAPGWAWLHTAVQAVQGAVLLWLALVWGLAQSLRIRLLAMLHVGFVWLGLTLLYGAASQALWLLTGQPVLGLGALHALGMGFLGSLMVAMVTRVSCGHSGRSLVADDWVWALFWGLQLAVVLRLAAAVQGAPAGLTLLAALAWAAVMGAWALRYLPWYGTPRVDGKPG